MDNSILGSSSPEPTPAPQSASDSAPAKAGKFKLTKLERRWAMYDAGNSAIYMFLILIAVSIGDLAAGTRFADDPTNTMSLFNGISGALVAVMGPILGAIADNKGRKKPLFMFFVFLGVAGCLLSLLTNFASLSTSPWAFFVPFAICMLMILIGLGGSLLFYDSMIGDITTEARSDNVSSRGFAAGYIFSLIPFAICLAIYYFFMTPSYSTDVYGTSVQGGYILLRAAITASLALSGLWWLGWTLPLLKSYRQLTGVDPVKHQIRDAFRKLGKTFKELKRYRFAFLFMLAFFFYINGVNTVIALSATYAQQILKDVVSSNLLNVFLIGALMGTQVISCIFSIIFGNLSKRFGAKLLITISVVGYLAFVIYGVFMKSLVDFFILAAGIGIFQGGIQALSRSYFSKLAPAEKQSEFFGLYDIFNKSSNFLGSLLYYALSSAMVNSGIDVTKSARISVGCLSVFFVIGMVLLLLLPKNHADEVVSE